MSIIEFEKQLRKDPQIDKAFKEKELVFYFADMVFEARVNYGMTQEELAKKIGTEQPSIARLENGNLIPSIETLYKIAEALDLNFILPRFEYKYTYLNNSDQSKKSLFDIFEDKVKSLGKFSHSMSNEQNFSQEIRSNI